MNEAILNTFDAGPATFASLLWAMTRAGGSEIRADMEASGLIRSELRGAELVWFRG
jgi:streptomycin 6-kinase